MVIEELNVLGLTLGAIVSALMIVATFVLNRKLSLFLFTLAPAVAAIQFGFVLDLWSLAVLNFLFMLRNISFNIQFLAGYRNPLIVVWLIIIYAVYLTVTAQTEGFTLLTVFPVFAILFQTVGLAQTNMLPMKTLITLNELIWFYVLVMSSLWGNTIGSAFAIISGIIAIVRILNLKANKKV
jgi:hypothetical protein